MVSQSFCFVFRAFLGGGCHDRPFTEFVFSRASLGLKFRVQLFRFLFFPRCKLCSATPQDWRCTRLIFYTMWMM